MLRKTVKLILCLLLALSVLPPAAVQASAVKQTKIKFEIFSVKLNYATHYQVLSFDKGMPLSEMLERGFKTIPKNKDFNVTIKDDVKINSVSASNELAVVDFNAAIEQNGYGHGGEAGMLNAIANTVGNYFNVGAVKITVEGKPYYGGHGFTGDGIAYVTDFWEPEISAVARVTENGMQDDYIYTFSNAERTREINPKEGEPILMLNGAFSPWQVVIENDRSYVPAEFINEKLLNEKLLKDMPDLGLQPYVINGKPYYPLRLAAEKLGMAISYLPAGQAGGIAHNPVVWLDNANGNTDKAKGELLQYLKETLAEGLEKGKKGNVGGRFEKEFENASSQIAEDIKNTVYIGQIGRYALYRGPYKILLDTDTNEIYFVKFPHNSCGIYKADMNNPELFWGGYIAG